MSDVMKLMPIEQLVDWTMSEYKKKNTVFGVYRPYQAKEAYNRTLFGRKLENPLGPAAGPNTQLAQNIIASYYGGSRFFELKTVQIMDGEELAKCVNKPCIKADDECYNCEWSTELYVPQAMEEYIKAWFVLSLLAKELDLGSQDGFQFNMSVGYDLAGIQSEKIDTFLNGMMEAKDTVAFQECKKYFLENLDKFEKITKEDVEAVSSNICNSATISTLHGCPPEEIEKIANYLIEEKGLHTYIKCNPTLLGYEFARKRMDEMGYDYVAFGDFHFLDDLQYEDAIPMLDRLMKLCEKKGLEFGVKITNTFPVDVKQNELPSEEMYMSGKSLYPLSIALAAKLSKEFDGKLRISYSGGADAFNIQRIVDAGIWPITVATTILKPGGYQRLYQMAEAIEATNLVFEGVDVEKAEKLAFDAVTDVHHVKAIKPLPSRKVKETVPYIDCFMAPCKEGCPINQDITAYMELTEKGLYEEALEVITRKNPLPFITGTICAHNCMSKCTRNFYDESVQIRDAKLVAAKGGYEAFMKKLKPTVKKAGEKVAIVGGGPTGIAAAYFLAKDGVDVTLFEKKDSLGGVVRHVIPSFRIPESSIEHDVAMIKALGVDIQLNTEIKDARALKEEGYTAVILAVGATKPGTLKLEQGETMNAIHFLEQFKATNGAVNLGKHVVVIGGGNTAMDTARAAKRTKGVEKVSLVYRRTKRFMPADEEELIMAIEDGVEFKELLAPISLEKGMLSCGVMELGALDASGRASVNATGELECVLADTVIVAVGEQISEEFLLANGVNISEKGKPLVDQNTLETSTKGIYVVGDGLWGPATVVEGIRDARKACSAILGREDGLADTKDTLRVEALYEKRGVLKEVDQNEKVDSRCLGCSTICENCVEVCPNRANVVIEVPELEMHQVIHIDSMCNECGNCQSFCPYVSAPYLDKFTLFATEEDMQASKNQGFLVIDAEEKVCKVRYLSNEYAWVYGEHNHVLPETIGYLIKAVCENYRYLWV